MLGSVRNSFLSLVQVSPLDNDELGIAPFAVDAFVQLVPLGFGFAGFDVVGERVHGGFEFSFFARGGG